MNAYVEVQAEELAFEESVEPATEQVAEERRWLVSVSLPCPGVEPMRVLGAASGQERFYWQDPRTAVTYVAFGVAADLRSLSPHRFQTIANEAELLFADAQIADGIPAFAEPQLFGGFAFSDDFTPDNTWSIYYPAQFILPHYQFALYAPTSGQKEAWLTINALLESSEHSDLIELRQQLTDALHERIEQLQQTMVETSTDQSALQNRSYPMNFASWEAMLNRALDAFNGGRLNKVVLSRVCELRFRQQVNTDAALTFLNAHYPDCFRFLFEPIAEHVFFGASPELLINLQGQQIQTMGLAGSERRGATPAEDDRLGQELLNSEKNQHEHKLVVDAIRSRLAPLCRDLCIPQTAQLLKLSNIQHLYTPIQGTLAQPQTIFDLVRLLHPTPALGGSPKEQALAFISQNEPVPRGWYGAPVGIVNRHLEGTFSVAIRSAVTDHERVWLHAGAGIVAASDPQKEWDETALKFRPILNALGVR
ncbi:MAG: isochorismate synthase [Caldilineaceae bacterium]